MILFQLKCPSDHRFDAWFRDGAAYEAQVADGDIACPVCGDTAVSKAPMAPRIAKSNPMAKSNHMAESSPVVESNPMAKSNPMNERVSQVQAEVVRQIAEIRRAVEENCDYVGDRFAEEARRIHYGEVEKRGIYGEATADDVAELREEGVTVGAIPWVKRTDS